MNDIPDDFLIEMANRVVHRISCYNTRSIGWRAEEMQEMRNELAAIEEEIAKRG